MQELRDGLHSAFASIEDTITASLNGVAQGTQTLEDAWQHMLISMALGVENYLIRGALTDLENALGRLAFGSDWAQQSGGLGAMGGLLGKLVGGIGGLFGGGGGTLELPWMQEGGIVTRPTLLVAGERETEWIIPQSKLGRLAGGVVTGPTVHQTIIINAGVSEEARRQIEAAMPEIRAQAMEALIQMSNKGGSVSRAVGRRQ